MVKRPWPTAEEAARGVRRLVIMVGASQFFLAGLDRLLREVVMFCLWQFGGLVVAFASSRIESYMARQRRFQR